MKSKNYKKILACLFVLTMLFLYQQSRHTNIENKINDFSHSDDRFYETEESEITQIGEIYLYGELHGEKAILDEEFKLWKDYYEKQEMRHLFIEMSYFDAEFLNLWMHEDDDSILQNVIKTQYSAENYISFYKRVKDECPETIFHGTDVGHNYLSIGIAYRNFLEDNNMVDSDQYLLNEAAIEQGKEYYSTKDKIYRENKMTENFIREFEQLNGESIMGIYGSAHTDVDAIRFNGKVGSMAMQLKDKYAERVQSLDLSYLAYIENPIRIDRIEIDGKVYDASYFGIIDATWSEAITHLEFWRIEDAYHDFENYELNGDVALSNQYPMVVNKGEVYVVDVFASDKSIIRTFYRCDGAKEGSLLITNGFRLERDN